MLHCRVGSMLSSVFWNGNIRLSEIFYFNTSESQTYSKYYQSFKYSNFVSMIYTFQRQFSNMQAYVIDNTCIFSDFVQILVSFIQKIILKGVSFISGKGSHAALNCFLYFCTLLVQINTTASKRTLQCEAFKLLCYFQLTILKEVKKLMIRWPEMIYVRRLYQIQVGISRTTSW